MDLEEVKAMLLAGRTYKDVSEELKAIHPYQRGLSERSVRRFVSKNNLRHTCETEKHILALDSIKEVHMNFTTSAGYIQNKCIIMLHVLPHLQVP